MKIKNYLLALSVLFTAQSWAQCDGLEVSFDWEIDGGDIYFENTTTGEGSTSTYSWTYFSQTSSDENPTMDVEVGLDVACLTVTTVLDSSGTVCTETFCDSVYWDGDTTTSEDPCLDWEPSFEWEIDGDEIVVENTSEGEGYTTTYNWSYGSQTSTDENPVFDGEEGLDVICLEVVTYFDSATFCTDVICDSIYFSADSTGGVSCDDVEANFIYYTDGTNIYFLDNSSTAGGTVYYEWDIFGDTYYEENPTVPYTTGDSAWICLYIQVWLWDGSDSIYCEDEYCEPYEEADSSVLSTPSPEELEAKLFPNPVVNELNISLTSDGFDQIEIYNTMGQLVYSENVPFGIKQKQISTADLNRGMYLIKVFDSESPERVISERFVRK